MPADLFQLPEPVGSYLMTVEIWRAVDGSVQGRLVAMPMEVVDGLGGDVPHKMMRVADLFEQAGDSMRSQAEALRG